MPWTWTWHTLSLAFAAYQAGSWLCAVTPVTKLQKTRETVDSLQGIS